MYLIYLIFSDPKEFRDVSTIVERYANWARLRLSKKKLSSICEVQVLKHAFKLAQHRMW